MVARMLSSRIGRFDRFPDPFFVDRGACAVKLSDIALKCVAFLGIKKDGKFQPRATAFFVQYEEEQHRFDHLVTAEHVISGLRKNNHDIWLRANLISGKAEDILLGDPGSFRFHPNNGCDATDVAVRPFSPKFNDDDTGELIELDYASLSLKGERSFLPSDEFTRESIGLGTEIAIVGLFRSHYGTNRNIPIVRVGNISTLRGEPIFTKYAGYIDGYLIEARSIAGLSGSPVFALPDSAIILAKGLSGKIGQGAALLGLMHGHFDVPNLNEDVVADDDEPTHSVHTGIGVVIPVRKILETIEHPELVAMRKDIVSRLRQIGAVPDVVPDEGADAVPPASDENPNHLEDFNRLVDVAARKRQQDDQS
jgi:hypothetical protein